MSLDWSIHSFVNQIRSKYNYDERVENGFVIFFKGDKVVYEAVVGEGNKGVLSFDVRGFMREGLIKDADSMIFLHNHTEEYDLTPSEKDIEATELLVTICYLLKIHFLAHIVFNDSEENLIYVGDLNRTRRITKS